MLNMDVTRLPGYLRQASESELATLAQDARDPKIIVAVQDEMERRQGGLMSDEMGPPPPQQAQPLPQPTQLAEVATEGWVPPWQRNDGTGPFPALVQEGPTADRSPLIPEDPWLRGARERLRTTVGSPYDAQLQSEGPVPEWQEELAGDDLPTIEVGERPVFDVDAADDLDIAPEAIEIAQALEEAGDNPDAVQALLAELQGSIQSPEDMRNMAIARAGFGMAASQNPYFFGALGEGANQGLDAYEKSRQEAFLNRVRSADLQQDQAKFGEQRRATGVAEKSDADKLKLTERDVALAERDYERKVREYEEGKASEAELKAAEVALRRAQAAYYAERPRSTSKADLLQDAEGNLMRLTPEGGAEYVTGPDGNPVKASRLSGSGQTAAMKNAKYYGDLLFGGDEAKGAAFLKSGSTMAPDQRLKTARTMAIELANSNVLLVDPVERELFIEEKTTEINDDLSAASASATGAGAASPGPLAPTGGAETDSPAYDDPNQVKQDYQSGKITKEQARQILQQMGQ